MSEIVLVCAAHPDDEVLGCGATMAGHAARGDEVHVLILGEGVTSRRPVRLADEDREALGALNTAAREANRRLGVASVEIHQLADNRMDGVELLDIVKLIESAVERHRPTIIYTHHAGDTNVDHGLVHDAVVAAARPFPGQSVQALLFFEVLSSTEWRPAGSGIPFVPNWFVDVSGMLEKKLAALDAYAAEMRPWPHPRSVRAVEHLARLRGCTVGVDAAEAFILGRRLVTK